MQDERGPRKPKSSTYYEKDVHTATVVTSTTISDDLLQHQILAKILISCISQSRTNEVLQCFSKNQQDAILRNVWSECFVLRASHWSIDINEIIER